VIEFQQDHSSIHNSRVVQEWLSWRANDELIDWPPQAPDMNPTENMWSKLKKIVKETWPVLPLTNTDDLWTLISDASDEVLLS
jgi:hypothetical protein